MKPNFNPIANFAPLMMISALIASPQLSFGNERAGDQEEVSVEKVFVPATGYDDNDNVVVRVEGTLPDPCYVLGNTEIKALANNTYEVHQYAWRRDTGVCAGNDDLYETSFSEDASLGRLSVGDYKILQHPTDDQTTVRAFSVSEAKMSTMDDFNYAKVTQVSVPDVIPAGQDVKVTISGTLSSSCNVISNVKIERQNDVFVVQPIELEQGDCGYTLQFFTKDIDLGQLPAGEYMIHVRAKNGRVVERTFVVLSTNSKSTALDQRPWQPSRVAGSCR
jgi:hypothetical protein